MITFRKGDGVKFIDPISKLIPILVADGWVADGKEPKAEEKNDELEALRAEAKELGLKVHHKFSAEKIAEMIAEAKVAA